MEKTLRTDEPGKDRAPGETPRPPREPRGTQRRRERDTPLPRVKRTNDPYWSWRSMAGTRA